MPSNIGGYYRHLGGTISYKQRKPEALEFTNQKKTLNWKPRDPTVVYKSQWKNSSGNSASFDVRGSSISFLTQRIYNFAEYILRFLPAMLSSWLVYAGGNLLGFLV